MHIAQDPELLAAFLDEAEEALAGVGRSFVQLERDAQDSEIIEGIFRPIHSLKGNAAFFGLLAIKRIAHEMETILDHMRKGRLAADRPAIDALLAGLDLLMGALARVRGGGGDDDPAAVEPLSLQLAEQAARAVGEPQRSDDDADMCLIEAALPAEHQPARAALARLRARLRHELPSDAPRRHGSGRLDALIERARVATLPDEDAQAALVELAALRDGAADAQAKAAVQETIDGLQVFITAMGFEAAGAQYLAERLRLHGRGEGHPAGGLTALERLPRSTPSTPPPQSRQHQSDVMRKDGGKSMRVAETAIDTFLHYVGELVVVGDMFRHLQTRTAGQPGAQGLARDFRRANETFAGLANQLQSSIMAIRRVPVKPLAQKIPRMVRDLSAAVGKEIEAVIEGEGVLVDKSLLDLLDAPLTHMVRNAVDHGIEAPDRRAAAGKPRRGTVTVAFAEAGRHISLTISDDGAGLDLAAIRRKAEGLGLIVPGAPLGEQDIIDLIFASGLSTAARVTDISGRGVGMDVVKRALEDAGGSISVSSEAGRGARFRIRLPRGVTTQIVAGYLVRAGGASYVLPLERVRETFRCRSEDRQSVGGRGMCILRRDQVVPLHELAALLGGGPAAWPRRGLPVVIVESQRRDVALAVDAVLGVQKVVIRRLAGLPGGAPMLAGAALLGDGHLALVLDLDHLHSAEAA